MYGVDVIVMLSCPDHVSDELIRPCSCLASCPVCVLAGVMCEKVCWKDRMISQVMALIAHAHERN